MQNTNHTEQELLTALVAGDRNATSQIFRKHYPVLTKWIMANGGLEADADDIFQEAMVILFEKAQDAEFRLTCKIGTYLFAIGKHLWYKRLQAVQKMPYVLKDTSDEEDAGWIYEDDTRGHEERELNYLQLEEALEKLGSPCNEVLRAYYHDDKSMNEIAALFGYTNPENAKTQKYKCLARLRKLFFTLSSQTGGGIKNIK